MSVFTSDVVVDNTVLVDGSAVTQPVSGTVTVNGTVTANVGTGTQPVSGTVTANQGTSPWVISGTVATTTANASTATITQVTLSTTNQVLLAANVNRKRLVIFTATGKTLVALGSVASATNFTYNLASANSTLELAGWTGSVQAIETGGSSVVTTTELV